MRDLTSSLETLQYLPVPAEARKNLVLENAGLQDLTLFAAVFGINDNLYLR